MLSQCFDVLKIISSQSFNMKLPVANLDNPENVLLKITENDDQLIIIGV